MRYLALATDYDGTLAQDGRVAVETWAAVRRLRQSGRKILLVTGRELDELRGVCPHVDLFDVIVAENGGLLFHPGTGEETALAPAPAADLVRELRERGVEPLSVGRTIVAAWRPHESTILEVIRVQRLALHVIFNKDAVMVLPVGVNKASGLQAALRHLELSEHNLAGIGDAENDWAFLSLCRCAAVVSNALPELKETADLVMPGDHGRGVVELIDALLADDLATVANSRRPFRRS